MFNATFNNISVISWRSVLLVEEAGVPGENHRHWQVTDQLYHIMLYRVCHKICTMQIGSQKYTTISFIMGRLLTFLC